MLIVEDATQKQYIAGIFPKTTLKYLTAGKKLFCPCCKEPVIYAAGDVNVPHFRHGKHSTCINTISESQEHLKKKLLVYQWLISKQYSVVKLEYWLPNTQQRADVYVETPEGEKYVMEIQCSPIAYNQWLDRHLKYKSLGIKDIWFFGHHFINQNFQGKFFSPSRSKFLLEKINKRNRYLYFLVDNGELMTTGTLINEATNYEPSLRHKSPSYVTLTHRLEDMIPKQTSRAFLWPDTAELLDVYNQYHQQIATSRNEKRIYLLGKREMRKKRKAQKKQKINKHFDEIGYPRSHKQLQQTKPVSLAPAMKEAYVVNSEERENYRSFLKSFSIADIHAQLSENEIPLFERLILKYNIADASFPPICLVELNLNTAIETPYSLWQLMILDELIQKQFNSDISLATIQKKILGSVRAADLLQASKLIHGYLITLKKIGLLTGGSPEAFYLPFKNKLKRFPKNISRKNTILVAYGLSKYEKDESADVLLAIKNELSAYRSKLN